MFNSNWFYFLYGFDWISIFYTKILFTIRFTDENCGAAISILEFIGYIVVGPYILFMAYLSKYGLLCMDIFYF